MIRKKRTEKGRQSKVSSTLPERGEGRGLVFISHDTRDAEIAADFGELIAGSTGGSLKFFRSSDTTGSAGINYGEKWFSVLMSNLSEASDVVALLTPHSLERPWILFEAGVAAGKAKASVFGVALGLSLTLASKGPFAQFQNCGSDEKSLTHLLIQLIRRNLADAEPREEAVRREVRAFRARLEQRMKSQDSLPSTPADDDDATARLYEEIKSLTRDLQARRRARFVGPRLFEEYPLAPAGAAGGLGWLIFIGAFRDELPWLYELGLEFYRALAAGDKRRIMLERERVLAAVKHGLRNDWLRSVVAKEDRERAARLHHLGDLVEIYLGQLAKPRRGSGSRVSVTPVRKGR